VHYDNLYVTKYVCPEPIQAGWGSEEASNWIPPTTPTPTPTPTAQPTDTATATPIPTPTPTQTQSQLTISSPTKSTQSSPTQSPTNKPTENPSVTPSQMPLATNNPVNKTSPQPQKLIIPPEILPIGAIIAVILAILVLTIFKKQQSHRKTPLDTA
jgi:hypothetical protein